MADTLRDLVVSLSLDTTNFSKNIKSVNTNIKEAQTYFKEMGAGVENYQQTLSGATNKITTLERVLDAQNRAIKENELNVKAMAEAYAKAEKNMNDGLARGEAPEVLDRLNNALVNAETNWGRANISLSNATAAQKGTNAELERARQELELVKNGWYESAESIERNDRALAILGDRVQIAANDYSAFVAGIKNADENQDALGKKSEMLGSKLETLGEKYQRLQGNLAAYQKQSKAAHEAGDNDKIRQTNQAISATEVSLSACRAEIARTTAELNDNNQQLTLVSNGWYTSAEAIEKSEHSLNILGYDLQKVGSDYEAYIAHIKDAEKSEEALAAKRDKLASTVDILTKKYEEQNKQLEEYKKQLEAARAAEDPDKIREAETNIARMEAALASTNATLQKTSAELKQVNSDLDGHVLKWKNAGEAAEKSGDKMIKAGKTMNRVGKSMTRTITTPLVALGTFSGKAYIDFEDSMAGVRKTVDATEEKFEELETSIRQMSLVTPTSASDIAFVMETAGQLGIATDAIEDFTKKMVDFGNVSNSLDSVTAAETFARYANIRGDAIEQNNDYFNRLTSTVFKLSNTMATTEADVSEMSMALAAAGTQVGMTDAQIVALAASLSSVGVSAQKGGTAFSKVLVKMEAAVAKGVSTNNKALADFSKVAGMTQEEFATLWKTDAGSAFMAFIDGVAKLDEEGVSAITTLQDLGLNEVRLRDTLLRTVNAQDLFVKAMASANDEWQTAEYMNEKVEERYASTANQIEILKNNATDLAMSIGEILLPYVNEFLGMARDFITSLKNMSKEELTAKLKTAAFAAAIGPALLAVGKLTTALGTVTKGVGGFLKNVGEAGGGLKGLGATLAKSPALWMALAAAVAYAGYKFVDWVTGAKAAREALQELDKTASEWEQNTTTAFENSKGLAAFNLDRDAFGLDSFSANANEWLTNLIDVWTDGKKETDEIVQGMVDSWVEGSNKIREAEGITDEDKKALDDIDKEIESILKKRQNGYLTDKDKERLDELIDERDTIAIHYRLVEDVDSGFDDIVTNVEAALARGADANDVWADAFKAAGEGYGEYMKQLNKEFDAQYADIMDSDLSDEEKANKVDELRAWYIGQKTEALNEYNAALEKSAELTGGAESTKYENTIQKLGTVAEAMKAAMGKNSTDPAVVRFAEELKGLDEGQIVELLTMIQAFETAGIELPENLALAKEYITSLMDGAEDFTKWDLPEDTLEKFKKMFGKENLEGEVGDVYLSMGLDTDDLTVQVNDWTKGPFDDLNVNIDSENLSVDASGVSVDGEAAVKGYLIGVSAKTGKSYGVVKPGGTGLFEIGVDGYLEKINADGTTTLIQDGSELPEGSKFSVDAEGRLTVVTADGTYTVKDSRGNPVYVGVAAKVTKVTGDLKTANVWDVLGGKFEPEVGATLGQVYAKADGDYTVLTEAGDEFRAEVKGVLNPDIEPPSEKDFATIREKLAEKLNAATESAAEQAGKRNAKKTKIFGLEYEDLDSAVFPNIAWLLNAYKNNKFGPEWVSENANEFAGEKGAYQVAQWLVWMQTQIDAGNEISDEDMEHYKQLIELFTVLPEESEFFTSLNAELPGEAGTTGREKLINSIKAQLGLDDYQSLLDEIWPDDGATLELKMPEISFGGDRSGGGGGSKGGNGGGRAKKQVQETIEDVLRDATEDAEPVEVNLEDLIKFNDLGNVDHTKRKVIKGEDLIKAGWGYDIDPDAIATLFTNRFNLGKGDGYDIEYDSNVLVNVTPILEDGTVLTPEELEDYVWDIANSGLDLLEADKKENGGKGLVIATIDVDGTLEEAAEEADDLAEQIHLIHEKYYSNFEDDAPDMTPVGVNMMDGIIAGVNSRTGALATALINAVKKAKEAVENDNKIASPSKVWRDEIGANLAKGIGEGVMQEAPAQGKIIANAARYLTDSAAGAMSGGHSSIAGSTTTNNNVSNSVVNHFNINASVRSDNDIRKLAQQIARLTQRVNGGYGMMNQLKA